MYKEIKTISTLIFIAGSIAMFMSCNSKEEKQTEERKSYVIPDSLAKTLNIDTVNKCPLIDAITLTGSVDFNEDHVVNIFPMVSGNIQNVNVQLGDYVTAGQTLAVVKSVEMAGFSNDLVNAETNLRIAEKELEKTKDLYKSGLASMTDSLSAEIAVQQAKSGLNKAQRVLTINGGGTQSDYIIKAPISGFIVQKNITNNTVIRADNGNNIFTISDLKNVWIQANVYESNISKIHLGDEVSVTTLSYPGRIFKGKVDKILNVLDPSNKVMKVRIVLPNDDYALKPQMFASVTVTNQENTTMLCVSKDALIFDNSQYFVLNYKGNGKADIIKVSVKSTLGDKVYLTDGVKEGDKVIASNALLIYNDLNN
ncbi:MAG: efflux RND transporter periplasmic adaptor subunit [Chitinophagaceae bacterium]|jgi:cobalt-zinc-cadmium efflux system membrane fusion protein|nr:efflux RND transporter periplasmic adaptor subunit [Chitinophagaceae bacterium]